MPLVKISTAGFNYIFPYTSFVEEFNQKAFTFLMESKDESDTPMDEEEANEIVFDYADSLSSGFVMLRHSKPNKPIYWDETIKRHALTKKRFELTVNQDFPIIEEIDDTVVNSILRPTLPISDDVWDIRTAW